MSPRIANTLLLLAGALWGMGFIAQETAMQDIGPLLFVGLRFLLAGLVVLPFAIIEQRRKGRAPSFDAKRMIAVVGAIFFLAMATQQIALLATTVTNAGFLTALYVVIVPIILGTILRERQPLIIWQAAVLALFGIFLLSGGELSALNWGDWLVIASALLWALHVILIGRAAGATGLPVTIAAAQFLICGALGLLGHYLAPLAGMPEPAITLATLQPALPEILYAGLIAGALAFTLQAVGQQYTSPSAAAILLSSESLFAALFGAILLSEVLSPIGYLGCALIFAAILMVELRALLPGRR